MGQPAATASAANHTTLPIAAPRRTTTGVVTACGRPSPAGRWCRRTTAGLSQVKARHAAITARPAGPTLGRGAVDPGRRVPAGPRGQHRRGGPAPPPRRGLDSHARPASAAPVPATPAAMSTTSETAQIATTMPTSRRRAPWRTTNAFWGPMATISDRAEEQSGDERRCRAGPWTTQLDAYAQLVS